MGVVIATARYLHSAWHACPGVVSVNQGLTVVQGVFVSFPLEYSHDQVSTELL